PGGTRRPPEAIERLAEPARALLDVAAHGGVGDGVEVAPPIALEPAREPEEVGGVLRVAVQQDDRRARIVGVERPHAPAAERERRGEPEERGRRALDGEGPGAAGPGSAVLPVRRARGRMAPALARCPPVRVHVEERARRDDAEYEQHGDVREGRHPTRTAAMTRRVKGRTLL